MIMCLVSDKHSKHQRQEHRHREQELLDAFHAPSDEQSVNHFLFGSLALLSPAEPLYCVAQASQCGGKMTMPAEACTDGTANIDRHENVSSAQGDSRRDDDKWFNTMGTASDFHLPIIWFNTMGTANSTSPIFTS